MGKRFTHFGRFIGITLLTVIGLFISVVWWPLDYLRYPEQEYDVLLIENVSVIDVEKDTVYPNQDIVIRKGIIEKMTDTSFKYQQRAEEKVKRIDGSNQFLLPALWDMHVHLTKQSPHIAYPAFIRYGVTHVRDMRGAYSDIDPFAGVQCRLEKWNLQVEKHLLIGPRLHGYSSFALEGPHRMYEGSPSFFNCATPADAVELVHYFARKNVSLIKVYNHIPRDAFFALMQEATRAGIPVAGHKPLRVSTIEASNAGMKSMEHAKFFIWDSYPLADSIRKLTDPSMAENTALRKDMLIRHDSILLHEMFAVFKKNNTWYCPTHLTRKQDAYAGEDSFRAKYNEINPILRFISFEDLDATLQEDTSALAREVYREIYRKSLQISGAAYRSGVKILAGSDVPELPGSSLHEELTELSKAGLSHFEVLRSATLYPAQYYGLDTLYGSIREGKKADFLLLSKNPLDAIENTTAISSIFFDGKHLDEAFLEELTRKVEQRQNSMIMSAKIIWDMLLYMCI
jgi:imidazolonepropionase-like amidohydrolase